MSWPPEPRRLRSSESEESALERAAPHHRPPHIMYDPNGIPYHFTVGQPELRPRGPRQPERRALPAELQGLVVVTLLVLAVIVVSTAAICAVVVLGGTTLMGLIGAAGAHLPSIGVVLIGIIVAVGWAARRIRGASGKR